MIRFVHTFIQNTFNELLLVSDCLGQNLEGESEMTRRGSWGPSKRRPVSEGTEKRPGCTSRLGKGRSEPCRFYP
jgi:hypothetical protein